MVNDMLKSKTGESLYCITELEELAYLRSTNYWFDSKGVIYSTAKSDTPQLLKRTPSGNYRILGDTIDRQMLYESIEKFIKSIREKELAQKEIHELAISSINKPINASPRYVVKKAGREVVPTIFKTIPTINDKTLVRILLDSHVHAVTVYRVILVPVSEITLTSETKDLREG